MLQRVPFQQIGRKTLDRLLSAHRFETGRWWACQWSWAGLASEIATVPRAQDSTAASAALTAAR